LVIFDRIEMENAAGRICKTLIPIRQEYSIGRKGKSIAICTLSSMQLLEDISRSPALMEKVLIVGRLLSENKGIDTIVRFTLCHPELKHILVCGKEAKGHQAGQALLSLHQNGVNYNNSSDGFIIGATGHYPVLKSSKEAINCFRDQIVKIYDFVGIDDFLLIWMEIENVENVYCN
jgi:tetrahydromethanopterin S-methyltransferase subunit A